MSVAPLRAPERALQGNIVDYLLEYSSWRSFAQRPYLVAPERTWSFGELADRIGRIANLLSTLDVQPGERVLFSVLDGIDFPALFLGIMKIGAVAVPINTYLKPHDYGYFINDSGARVVIIDSALADMFAALHPQLPAVTHIITARAQAGDFGFLDELTAAQSPQCASYPTDPDAMAFWLYSSGSTGVPKGVV